MTVPCRPTATDEQAIFAECRAAQADGREISDACARAIATAWHGGPGTRAYAFACTGAIIADADPASHTRADIAERDGEAPTALWREIFAREIRYGLHGRTTHRTYDTLPPDWRHAADMFGTYLCQHTARGPQPGWPAL